MTQFIAYYRVSTKRQGDSGLGLDAQQHAVKEYLSTLAWSKLVTSFTEVQSGKDNDRPQLLRALKRCKLTNSTLLIAKLDRLSRDAAFLLQLQHERVKFIAADMPDANELTVGLLAVVAQAERKAISDRTRAALAAAKRRGVKLGNPHLQPGNAKSAAHARSVRRRIALTRAEHLRELVDDARSLGFNTLQSIADHLNSINIRTPRDCKFTRCSVRALINLLL